MKKCAVIIVNINNQTNKNIIETSLTYIYIK